MSAPISQALTQAPSLTVLALFLVAVVMALVAWALQLMQAASERREFALMLAGCMVCSAAVGLATVMVITVAGPGRLEARVLLPAAPDPESGIILDAILLPWDQPPARTPSAAAVGML
ncbi:MAG: hypothetical protein ACKOZT_15445 [Cyanobium sp.]